MNNIIEKIMDIEERVYAPNNYEGLESEPFCRAFKGGVVLMAPHNVRHLKNNGRLGLPEVYTASTATHIARTMGTGLIVATRSPIMAVGRCFPNFYDQVEYKDKVYVDIHGAKDKYGFDFCVGMGNNPSDEQFELLRIFKDVSCDFKCNVDDPFPARFVNSCPNNSLGIQIEISRRLRDPIGEGSLFIDMVGVLTRFVEKIR